MEKFIARGSKFPNRRKLVKLDANGNVTGEPIIVDIIRDSVTEGNEVPGTPITTDRLNEGNWRTQKTLSFTKMPVDESHGEVTPIIDRSQIYTLGDGSTWLKPPGNLRQPIRLVSREHGTIIYLPFTEEQIEEMGGVQTLPGFALSEVHFSSDPQEQLNEVQEQLNGLQEVMKTRFADIKKRLSHSFEEVNTGKRWIDGSYIYRKTIEYTGLLSDHYTSIGSVISVFDTILDKLVSVSVAWTTTAFFENTQASGTSPTSARLVNGNVEVFVNTANPLNGTWLLAFEYTKKPRLEDYSWEDISKISQAGNARKYWSIGETKTIILSDGWNSRWTLEIIGFDHDDKTSGGKAGITFAMRELMHTIRRYNTTETTAGGWNASYLRQLLHTMVWVRLPNDLQEVIVSVDKRFTFTASGPHIPIDELSSDLLFIPSEREMTNRLRAGVLFDGEQYELYRHNGFADIPANRIKHFNNGVGSRTPYWFRTVENHSRRQDVRGICADGNNAIYPASTSLGICVCFCI